MKTTNVHGQARTNEHPDVVVAAELEILASFKFEEQIHFGGEANIGLSIGMSTSGKSKNVLNALQYSNKINSTTCLICGNNELNYQNIDFVIKVPSKDTGTIQTVTQVIYHSICQALENQ